MSDLDGVAWPPQPIRTRRLTLRGTQASDRAGVIDLLSSELVRTYLGGPLDRHQLERDTPEVPADRPGVFAIADGSGFAGIVRFDRRDPSQMGHIRAAGDELEVSYMLLPGLWGRGYATEAIVAALDWAAGELQDSDVILCTQVANHGSRRLADRLGFAEVEQFPEHGADQWLGARALPARREGVRREQPKRF